MLTQGGRRSAGYREGMLPTLLDGPLGTELSARGIATPAPGWSAYALTDAPEVVADIHRRYAAARGGPSVRYEHFVASLARQVPDILRQGSCREVTFDVEVREGRAVVKARPKK